MRILRQQNPFFVPPDEYFHELSSRSKAASSARATAMSEKNDLTQKPIEQAPEENAAELRDLRRSVRDLVALAMLPALWTGKDPAQIADSLADAVLSTLRSDLVYVRLEGLPGVDIIEAARANRQPEIAG